MTKGNRGRTPCRTYPQTLLLAKASLHRHCVRVVVCDEPAVPTDALSRNGPLVDLLLGSLSGEVFVLEGAVVPTRPAVLVTRPRDVEEAAAEERDPQQNFLARYSGRHEVLDARIARRLALGRGVELGVVAALVGPLAVEVVGHQVEGVEIVGRLLQVNVLEDGLRGWESGGEKIVLLGEVDADRCDQGEEIVALLRSAGVLPNNYTDSKNRQFKAAIKGVNSYDLLSMPSRPDASTKPRAERAKLSRRTALDATTGNVSAESPPPMDSTTCRWGYLCFRCMKDPRAPWTPSQGALVSAYSSLS